MYIATFSSETDAPEALRPHLKKGEDEVYSVSMVPAAKLAEFRDTNLTVSKERDALKSTLSELAPLIGEDFSKIEDLKKKYAELLTVEQQVSDGKLQTSQEIAAAVETRTAGMREEHAAQLKHIQGILEQEKQRAVKAENKYKQTQIDRAITEAVLKPDSGARQDALSIFVRNANEVFRVGEDGSVTPYDSEGRVIYGLNGTEPQSPSEWLKKQAETHPYLFKDSTGGGATGGGKNNMNIPTNLPPEERLRLARERAA